jgi:glycosyltransferase involved in cell wall biosynthesis
MIKILHIITRLDIGGSAQNTLLTCTRLSRKYEMVLVHGRSLESNMTEAEQQVIRRNIERARKQGVRFICLSSLIRRINPVKDLWTLFSLFWILFREKPAIVHTHTSKAGLLGRLAAKMVGVPVIIHTAHGHVFYGHFGRWASRFFLWIEKIFAHFTDRLIALTEGEREDYIVLSVAPHEKITTIHSGVDIDGYLSDQVDVMEKKHSLGLPSRDLVVGFVGWLLPVKGPLYLLRAMAEVWKVCPDITLVFAGKGDLDVELRGEALQIGANGRVKFLGWRDDIDEIMPVLDIFVLPSLNEGMGRVLVEAMAAGKPVIASRVGGIPDLVKNEKTGLLVPPRDVPALADAILRLVNNPDKRRRMGGTGRIFCRRFSLTEMIDKIDKLYDELLYSPQKVIRLKPERSGPRLKELINRYSPSPTLPVSPNLSQTFSSSTEVKQINPE